MSDPAITLSLAQARHQWLVRQRLMDGPARPAGLLDVLRAIGWIPLSPARGSVYVALWARGAITHRADLDDAVFQRGEVCVVPGPQGGEWLVPVADVPLARAFAVADHASRETRVASGCALTDHDLRSTRDALREALASPITPDALSTALPPAALRSLGEVGRRAGSLTLAHLVLRGMWVQGEVARVPVEPRLVCVRYRYVLEGRPRRVPYAADAVDSIAARWLAAHAPVTGRAFATAFGIATGRAMAALKPLRTVSTGVSGLGTGYLMPADPVVPAALADAPPVVNFLSWQDPWLYAHPDLDGLCSAEAARAVLVRALGPSPCVLVDGALVGRWRWDGPDRVVRWQPLGEALPTDVSARIDTAARSLTDFIAGELPGDSLGSVPARKSAGRPTGIDVVP